MTSLESALRHIHADLTEVRVAFASIGGLAVSARTEPRFTRDANLAVAAANDAEAEALIALKVLSRADLNRPQDLIDLRALLRVASSSEVARAREPLTLIAARGYHRGRDLAHEMRQLLDGQP